jgi:hypothetical protein
MRLLASIVLATWLLCSAVAAQVAEDGVETVLVTGEQPGPSLWEVTDGEHSLWLLASYAPLPSGLQWKSNEVAAIIAQAQEVIGPYQASFEVSDSDTLRAKKSRLKRVLPRKEYARWRALKKQYIGDVDTEELLPAYAAMLLRVSALQRSGLVYTDDLWRTIYTLAHRHGVPVSIAHQVKIPVTASDRSAKNQQRIGVDYLIETMDRLENELRNARIHANAWATGDIEALRELAASDQEYAALNAHSWPFLQGDELQAALARTDENWIEAADAALKRNVTTFAVLPAYLVFQEDGPLAALRSKGYVVIEPHADQ